MTTTARILLALTVSLALCGVIFASSGVTHQRTVQEIDFWMAAGCDEACLQQRSVDEADGLSAPMDISNLF